MTYNINLEDQLIGTTLLEKGDAPMGVVMGKIDFTIENIGYDFLKEYCVDNNIPVYNDYPEDKLLTTAGIPKLLVRDENGIEIKGIATYIEGMDNEGFEVTIQGIPYPFYEEQFPHHVERYENVHATIDEIETIGINEKNQLYIKPKNVHFIHIWREAKEVHWNNEGQYLYSPEPREWSYLEWYQHIIKVIKEGAHCQLELHEKTLWINIPENLKNKILSA